MWQWEKGRRGYQENEDWGGGTEGIGKEEEVTGEKTEYEEGVQKIAEKMAKENLKITHVHKQTLVQNVNSFYLFGFPTSDLIENIQNML